MLSKEECIVLRHYLSEGVSKTFIARKLRLSGMIVYRHTAPEIRLSQVTILIRVNHRYWNHTRTISGAIFKSSAIILDLL